MKKSTLTALYNYLNGNASLVDVATMREEVNAEYDRLTAKAQANADLYATAKAAEMDVLSSTPQTVAEIYAAAQADLPEDFPVAKVQYALLHYWEADVVKHDNGKKPNTYTKRV